MSTATATYSVEVSIPLKNNFTFSVDVTEEHTAQDLIEELLLDEKLKLPKIDSSSFALINAQTKQLIPGNSSLTKDSKLIMEITNVTHGLIPLTFENISIKWMVEKGLSLELKSVKWYTAGEVISMLEQKYNLPKNEDLAAKGEVYLVNTDQNIKLQKDEIVYCRNICLQYELYNNKLAANTSKILSSKYKNYSNKLFYATIVLVLLHIALILLYLI